MSQQLRRRDPYPWTWEVPVGAVMTVLVVLTLGVHLGRAVANLLAGAGWRFPARVDLFSSLPGVLAGDAAAGLPAVHGTVASPTELWVWLAITELLLLTLSVVVLKLTLDRWGPGRMGGMATRTEAERLLGVSRLRRNGPVIRPDLYGKGRDR